MNQHQLHPKTLEVEPFKPTFEENMNESVDNRHNKPIDIVSPKKSS